jgi:hypothetical protein
MAIVIGEPVALFGVPRTDVAAAGLLLLPVAAGVLDVEVDVELELLLLHPAMVTARPAAATLRA